MSRWNDFVRFVVLAHALVVATDSVKGHVLRAPKSVRGVVDVSDFGAVGDGVTDSITAIEAALGNLTGAANDGGGMLYFPPGRFAVSRPLVLTDLYGIELVGAGAVPSFCPGAGSALLALTTNVTVLVLNRCTMCAVTRLAIGHASQPCCLHSRATVQRTLPTGGAAHRATRRTMPHRFAASENEACESGEKLTLGGGLPASGVAVDVVGSFQVVMSQTWIASTWVALRLGQFANTFTLLDSQISDVFGPAAVLSGGLPAGNRVDILMMSRITMNQGHPSANATVVWIDIGAGTNTVRLDNVGLINGGIGVRMDSPADSPAGVSPGRPLFLIANDLEIDFPLLNAIELGRGEEAQLSNCYVQGSKTLNGIYIGENWNSEITVVNTRIFGHNRSGIVIAGGVHTLISNNLIGDNSIGGMGMYPGVLVAAGVSDFLLTANHIGATFRGQPSSAHKAGIAIEQGVSDRYVVSSNTLTGNEQCLIDGGTGAHKSVAGNVCA